MRLLPDVKAAIQAVIDRMGPALPQTATPVWTRLAVVVAPQSAPTVTWALPVPMVVTSWRARSTDVDAFIRQMRIGQVTVLTSPTPQVGGTAAGAAATDLWDTAQTRSGAPRGWPIPALNETFALDVSNNTDEAQTIELLLEGYSPPETASTVGRLLTWLSGARTAPGG